MGYNILLRGDHMADYEKIEDVLSCDIEEFFSDNVINKSRKYLLGQRITDYQYNDGKIVQAFVKGSYNYFVTLSVFDGDFFSTCTCSSIGKCEHMAALFLHSKDKLVKTKVIDLKSFDTDCNDFYNEIKKEVNNRNVISKEYFPTFSNVISDKIEKLKNKDGEEFVDYYIKLMSSLEKYNFNSYLDEEFALLKTNVSDVNPNLIVKNINKLLLDIKDLSSMIVISILEYLLKSYVNYVISVKEIDLQNNRNAVMLINYIYKLVDTSKDNPNLNKYQNIIDYYSGIDKAIKIVEDNLDDELYLYAYTNLLVVDGEYDKAIEAFMKFDEGLSNNSFKYNLNYLMNVADAIVTINGVGNLKIFLTEYVSKSIKSEDDYKLITNTYNYVFDELFKCEFLLSIKKNNNISFLNDEKLVVFKYTLEELDYEFEKKQDDILSNSFLMNSFMYNYFYHIEKLINDVGYYDYNGNKKIIQYLNKLEKLSLGKYYIYELYLYACNSSKDNLIAEMKKHLRFINY